MNQTNYYNSTNWKLNIQLNNYQKKKKIIIQEKIKKIKDYE